MLLMKKEKRNISYFFCGNKYVGTIVGRME